MECSIVKNDGSIQSQPALGVKAVENLPPFSTVIVPPFPSLSVSLLPMYARIATENYSPIGVGSVNLSITYNSERKMAHRGGATPPR